MTLAFVDRELINLTQLYREYYGILQWRNPEETGEATLINCILPSLFQGETELIIFDIGANEGNYTAKILERFPECRITCFEPNVLTATRLRDRFQDIPSVTVNQSALGDRSRKATLFDYASREGSPHASLFAEVLLDHHGAATVSECLSENILSHWNRL